MIGPIIIAVLALAGGASYVAETALPGDPLHTIKISVNERVMSAITYNNVEDRANWEANLALRRLHETSELELRNILSTDMVAKLSGEFESHTNAAIEAALASSNESLAMEIKAMLTAALEKERALFMPSEGKTTFVVPRALVGTLQTKTEDNAIQPNKAAPPSTADEVFRAGPRIK